MHLKDFPQLQTATPEEKLRLIDELWASIAAEALPTPASHTTELDRRLQELERQPEKALEPEIARERLRRHIQL